MPPHPRQVREMPLLLKGPGTFAVTRQPVEVTREPLTHSRGDFAGTVRAVRSVPGRRPPRASAATDAAAVPPSESPPHPIVIPEPQWRESEPELQSDEHPLPADEHVPPGDEHVPPAGQGAARADAGPPARTVAQASPAPSRNPVRRPATVQPRPAAPLGTAPPRRPVNSARATGATAGATPRPSAIAAPSDAPPPTPDLTAIPDVTVTQDGHVLTSRVRARGGAIPPASVPTSTPAPANPAPPAPADPATPTPGPSPAPGLPPTGRRGPDTPPDPPLDTPTDAVPDTAAATVDQPGAPPDAQSAGPRQPTSTRVRGVAPPGGAAVVGLPAAGQAPTEARSTASAADETSDSPGPSLPNPSPAGPSLTTPTPTAPPGLPGLPGLPEVPSTVAEEPVTHDGSGDASLTSAPLPVVRTNAESAGPTDSGRPLLSARTSSPPSSPPAAGAPDVAATAPPGRLPTVSTAPGQPLPPASVDSDLSPQPSTEQSPQEPDAPEQVPVPPSIQQAVTAAAGSSPRVVAVRRGPAVDRRAASLAAAAFAVDGVVHLPGSAPLTTDRSRRLLTHELTHVVQQQSGRAPATETSPAGLEAESQAQLAEQILASIPGAGAAPPGLSGAAAVPGAPGGPRMPGTPGSPGGPGGPRTPGSPTAPGSAPRPVGRAAETPGQPSGVTGRPFSRASTRASGPAAGGLVVVPRSTSPSSPDRNARLPRSSGTPVRPGSGPGSASGSPSGGAGHGASLPPGPPPRAGQAASSGTPQSSLPAVTTRPPSVVAPPTLAPPAAPSPAQRRARSESPPPPPPAAAPPGDTPRPPDLGPRGAWTDEPPDTAIDDQWLERHAAALYPHIRRHLRNELLRDRERRGRLIRED